MKRTLALIVAATLVASFIAGCDGNDNVDTLVLVAIIGGATPLFFQQLGEWYSKRRRDDLQRRLAPALATIYWLLATTGYGEGEMRMRRVVEDSQKRGTTKPTVAHAAYPDWMKVLCARLPKELREFDIRVPDFSFSPPSHVVGEYLLYLRRLLEKAGHEGELEEARRFTELWREEVEGSDAPYQSRLKQNAGTH
ncbi:MAG: hypothetical protein OYK82_07700 [Gammaproteobacteria bacterium]|nr:hypothetical protein [Gammaproteobacteria bacterium]